MDFSQMAEEQIIELYNQAYAELNKREQERRIKENATILTKAKKLKAKVGEIFTTFKSFQGVYKVPLTLVFNLEMDQDWDEGYAIEFKLEGVTNTQKSLLERPAKQIVNRACEEILRLLSKDIYKAYTRYNTAKRKLDEYLENEGIYESEL